jgi:hypothetical protein
MVFVGLAIGVVAPLVTIQPDEPSTVVAALVAIAGLGTAYLRWVFRTSERSAGQGVPL